MYSKDRRDLFCTRPQIAIPKQVLDGNLLSTEGAHDMQKGVPCMIIVGRFVESLDERGTMYKGVTAQRMYILEVLLSQYANLLPVR